MPDHHGDEAFLKRDNVYLLANQDLGFLSGYKDRIERLLAILESSFDGIYITDGDATTIWCNRSYEVISGLVSRDVIGKNMRQLEQNEIISRSGTLLALQNRAAITLEQTFKTGKQAVITSTPIFDSSNTIVMVVTNVRDMSELNDLKQQLARNQEIAQRYQTENELIRRQLMVNTDLVAVDRSMLELLRVLRRVSKLDTSVLLLGETGVGKERMASFIHQNSPRKDSGFIKVNCGAIAENLAESELFGYERGAFTGANREGKPGLFEVADKGTIFLDEVGELPPALQTKLLRVLQEQELVRVGGSAPIKLNVRVLAATNRDLKKLVDQGRFREDLYYRLSVFPVTIPPLRERKNDIPSLAENMLETLNKKYGEQKTLSRSALASLMDYTWPGNVRELKNVMERAFIMSESAEITPSTLSLMADGIKPGAVTGDGFDLKEFMQRTEFDYISQAFQTQGNLRAAARSLNMDPATFLRKRKKYQEIFPSE